MTRTARSLVVAIVVVLVIAAGAGGFYGWELRRKGELEASARDLDDAIAVAERTLARRGEVEATKARVAGVVGGLAKVLPPASELDAAKQEAEAGRIAGEAGVTLRSFRELALASGGEDGGLVERRFRLVASGTFEQVVRFLHRIETRPAFCRIDALDVEAGGDTRDGHPVLNVAATLSALGRP